MGMVIVSLVTVSFEDGGMGLTGVAASYLDFWDAGHIKWVERSSDEKMAKLMDLYGDDTFTKLMKKVKPYEF